jgi:hypothetical protein
MGFDNPLVEKIIMRRYIKYILKTMIKIEPLIIFNNYKNCMTKGKIIMR